MQRRFLLAASIFAALLSAHAELKVVSLSTITTDIAKNVGGDKISLVALVQPGTDPHEFQPTPGDVRQIANADLVLITGRHIEGYLAKLEQATGGEGKFIDTGKNSTTLRMEEDGQSVDDPHWWHSVANVEKAAGVIRDAFSQAEPAQKAFFDQNAAVYLLALNNLQKWTAAKVAELPPERRKLVTSHDAFQYFARDYGFKIYAVEGISSDAEPSSRKVAKLIDLIKAEKVKTVFAENIENPKVLESITRETRAKLGPPLYADGLGDKEAKTYIEMMRYNLTTIVEALK